jgi:hypothetical protein
LLYSISRAFLTLEQFQEKWEPVFRPELRQGKVSDQFIKLMN